MPVTIRSKRSPRKPVEPAYLIEVARGAVGGSRSFSIPGRRDSVANGTFDDITETVLDANGFQPNPGGAGLRLVSTSADDDAAGIGVQSVTIDYLDTLGVEQQETIDLAGLAPVNTVNIDYDRIQWMHAKGVGTSGQAIGNIVLQDLGGTIEYESITMGHNQSLSARYHVPAGCTAYVIAWDATASGQKVEFLLRATMSKFNKTLLPGVYLGEDLMILTGSSLRNVYSVPLQVPANASIKIVGKSSGAGGNGACSFDLFLLDEG